MKAFILATLAALSLATAVNSASAAGMGERDSACQYTITAHGIWDCR